MLFVFIYLLIYYFSPFAINSHPPSNQSTHCCPCPWVIHTCSLTSPFPFFPLFSPPLPSGRFPLFHISMFMVLFCSLVYVVHLIPPMSEIIGYLSFTPWLISLSVIVSSFIHAVAKGRNSFFCIVFHCVNVPHFSIHSSTDRHLGCFQHLAIVNNAAVNIGIHVILNWCLGILRIYSQ